MKRISTLLVCSMLFVSSYAVDFAGGDGTSGNPYKIATAAQLNEIRNNLTAHYILLNDIDVSTDYPAWIPLGKTVEGSTTDRGMFNGVFDGQGHVISGININYSGRYVGFFSAIGGTVKNLGVKGMVADTFGGAVGLLAGYLGQAGGDNTIENCFAEGIVIAADLEAGGGAALLAATIAQANAVIRNCYVKGSVSSYAGSYTGGISGRTTAVGTILTNCYSEAEVSGTEAVGGIIGQSRGNNMTNCYATGAVTGNQQVGGIVGRVNDGTISGFVAANASVSATTDLVGRVAGNLVGTASDVYGLKNMTIKKGGAAVSVVSNLYDKDGLNTDLVDMQSAELYEDEIGWDFENIWKMPETAGFPVLQWQTAGGTNIPSVSTDDAKVFFQGKLLHIEDLNVPTDVKVYSVAGQLIKSTASVTGSTVYILPQAGVYIVKLASKGQTRAIKVINQ